MRKRDYSPTRPRVAEVSLTQLSDKEWRYAWANPKIRWAIAKQIHDIRIAKGWTQKDLAQRAGLWQPTIARIENPASKMGVTLSSLVAIAGAFDMAFVCRFAAWSEWMEFMAALEAEGGWTPPLTFDEEVAAGR